MWRHDIQYGDNQQNGIRKNEVFLFIYIYGVSVYTISRVNLILLSVILLNGILMKVILLNHILVKE
jgi:hypothetical protein